MYKNRSEFKGKRGFYINLPSLEDLRKTKLARKLPKDKEDIKYIEFLLRKQK